MTILEPNYRVLSLTIAWQKL